MRHCPLPTRKGAFSKFRKTESRHPRGHAYYAERERSRIVFYRERVVCGPLARTITVMFAPASPAPHMDRL